MQNILTIAIATITAALDDNAQHTREGLAPTLDVRQACFAAVELLLCDLNYEVQEHDAPIIARKYIALLTSTGLSTHTDILRFIVSNSDALATALRNDPTGLYDDRPFSDFIR